ncbi:MAG: beta-propeller domain-containing protein, partial [Nocardioidaceae bacterium]
MRRSSKRIWAVSVAAGGLFAGVATVIGATPGSAPPAVADELKPFDDCEQLRSWYVETALPHVTAWGWDTDGPIMYDVMPMPSPTRAAEAPAVETDAIGNGATGTNLQEIDVDEPDVAKTDGELVALIRGGDLIVYDASGDQPREIGRVHLADRLRVTELLLVGDHAVLLGSATTPILFLDPPIGV